MKPPITSSPAFCSGLHGGHEIAAAILQLAAFLEAGRRGRLDSDKHLAKARLEHEPAQLGIIGEIDGGLREKPHRRAHPRRHAIIACRSAFVRARLPMKLSSTTNTLSFQPRRCSASSSATNLLRGLGARPRGRSSR